MTTPFKHFQRRQAAGISIHAEILLDLCRRFEKPGCSQNELKRLALAEGVGSPATLHHAIHELIEAKLVDVKPSERDKRANRLTVTPKGLRFLGGEE